MARRWLRHAASVGVVVLLLVMIPAVAFAISAAFTSSSATTPAVSGTNSSTSAGAKGVVGTASGTSSNARYGVVGSAGGTGGIGVWGGGSKYGVFSNGPLGVAAGQSLSCSGCVHAVNLASGASNDSISVSCPPGEVATGGGGVATVEGFGSIDYSVVIARSEAVLTNGEPTGWVIAAINNGTLAADVSARVVCTNAFANAVEEIGGPALLAPAP